MVIYIKVGTYASTPPIAIDADLGYIGNGYVPLDFIVFKSCNSLHFGLVIDIVVIAKMETLRGSWFGGKLGRSCSLATKRH
jgi:hypothetical protein